MDTTPPTSTVNSLPTQTTSTSFTVSVTASGPDGANGSTPSVVASIAIYDSTNGGPFALFTTVTPSDPSATFTGRAGNTYAFYSIATDKAGNLPGRHGDHQEGKKTIEHIPHPITNFTVTYSAASDAVMIAFTGKETFPTGGQITVLGGLTTTSGGTLSGPAEYTISKGGKSIGAS
jgi:hypothetical protein